MMNNFAGLGSRPKIWPTNLNPTAVFFCPGAPKKSA